MKPPRTQSPRSRAAERKYDDGKLIKRLQRQGKFKFTPNERADTLRVFHHISEHGIDLME
jgi:hypothetical protein